MEQEYYVYLYYEKTSGQIIYVGKATGIKGLALYNRIGAHAQEDKFMPYLENVEIKILPLKNKAEARGIELLLINMYKPILNAADKYEQTSGIEIDIMDRLISYKQYEKNRNLCFSAKSEDKKSIDRRIGIYNRLYQKALYEYDNANDFYKSVEQFVSYLKESKEMKDNTYFSETTNIFSLKIQVGKTNYAVFKVHEMQKDGAVGVFCAKGFFPELKDSVIKYALPQTLEMVQKKRHKVKDIEGKMQIIVSTS